MHEGRLSEHKKVSTLKARIRTDNVELKASKLVISNDSANDFTGACGYFSGLVTDLHGDAQLEYAHQCGKKCHISSTGSGCGHGHGRFGGHGGCGRGRGISSSSNTVVFNGIDVTQYTQNFTSEEWQQMGGAGHMYVNKQRKRNNDGGRGGGRGSKGDWGQELDAHVNQEHSKRSNDGGRGGGHGSNGGWGHRARCSHGNGNGEHNIGSVKSCEPDGTGGGNDSSTSGDCGRRNGRGFGCSTYGKDN